MLPERLPLVVCLLAPVAFLGFLFMTTGPFGVGPGRPLELVRADDGPHGSNDAEAANLLATISPVEAVRLEGKVAQFLVVLDGPATSHGKYTLYEVVVPGANDLGRTGLLLARTPRTG